MGKTLYLSLLVVLGLTFTACSGSSPEDIAKSYVKDMYKTRKATEKLFDYMAKPDDVTNDEFKKGKEKFLEDLTIKSIEVVKNSEGKSVTYEDGENKAIVELKLTLKNGKVEEETVNLLKQNGSWKVDDYGFRYMLK